LVARLLLLSLFSKVCLPEDNNSTPSPPRGFPSFLFYFSFARSEANTVCAALFGFLLSFYVDQWIDKSGYIGTFGALAGISAAVFVCVIPFYFWGNQLRHKTWQWGFVKNMLHWNVDREVGE
jgi:hypothetical protein